VFFGEEEGSPEGFYRVCGGEVVGGPYGDSRETGSQASEKPVQETREIPTVVTALGLLIAVILMVVGFRFRARQAAEAEKAHAAIPHHDRLSCPKCNAILGAKSMITQAEILCKCGTRVNTVSGHAI
jgi:hypothetical protein